MIFVSTIFGSNEGRDKEKRKAIMYSLICIDEMKKYERRKRVMFPLP
jgi:hypothetical protein